MTEFETFAKDFALRAGKIMRENFGLGMAKQWKGDKTPVTETDLAINALLIKEVKAAFPHHRIKAEEESAMEGEGEYVWVCDPVDGTIPFSHGIPISTFSLALTQNGKSILGVVYDPFQDRLFSASLGNGAFLNDKLIKVSTSDKLTTSIACYEMFHNERYNIEKLIHHLRYETETKLMTFASIVYPSVLVAAGELTFTIFPNHTAHDAAAVKIIVEEAGGKVTDLFGNDQRYDRPTKGFIASNGLVHDELIDLAKKLVNPQ